MIRIPFQLPDFTRRQWVSAEARSVWQPRLKQMGDAWADIEVQSVVHGIRRAHLTSISPALVPERAAWAAQHGLALLPLRTVAQTREYSATSRNPRTGEAWDYRAAYVRAEDAGEWSAAWHASDDDAMGTMLGYPECCRRFFVRVWAQESHIDTTWSMCGDVDTRVVDLRNVDPLNQILGRWAGYRSVPHLPCSWDCAATREFGRTLLDLGDELGHHEAVQWLRNALSWPHEWSALHGIAEIRSPILRITARTDATAHEHIIRVHSDRYPAEGAQGTRFPYKTWREKRLVNIKPPPPKEDEPDPRHNGFSNRLAMDRAHGILIQAAAPLVGKVGSIIDLGAGDGTLLSRMGEALGARRLIGVEIDPARAAAAAEGTEIRTGSISDTATWGERANLIVLMPGRLEEMSDGARNAVIQQLAEKGDTLLLYTYSDWLRKLGSLGSLVARTLPTATAIGGEVTSDIAAAALYRLS